MPTREEVMGRQVVFLEPFVSGEKWIGFKAKSVSGEEKIFLHWQNLPQEIAELEKICKAIQEQHNAEALIGPAIDRGISIKTGQIVILEKTPEGEYGYGIYIESRKRYAFTMFLYLKGLKIT